MKLHEILTETNKLPLVKLAQIVKDYTNEFIRSTELDNAVDQLLQDDVATYNGTMFRTLVIRSKDILKVPDVRMLTSRLHQFDIESKGGHRYVSWSKTREASWVSILNNEEAGLYDHMGRFVRVWLILEQTGKALDVEGLLGDEVIDLDEKELLATYQNTVHVSGFRFGNEKYDVDNFREFLNDVKDYYHEL